jgi:hypothetical protein
MTESAPENAPQTPETRAPRIAVPRKKNPNRVAQGTASSEVETQGETVFGIIPGKATSWSLEKEMPGGQIQKQQHPNAERTAYVQEWPIAELSEETVRDRWGGGRFRVRWHGHTVHGQRVMLGQGRVVTIIDNPPSTPQPSLTAPPDDLQRTFTLMRLFDERAQASLANVLQAAGAIANSNRGMDPAMLQLMMQNQQQQMAQLVTELRTASDRQIAELRAEMQASQVRAARPIAPAPVQSAVGAAASAVKDALIKPGEPAGDQIKAAFMNYAIENPNAVVDVIKSIPQILEGVAKVIQPKPAPAQARARRQVIDVQHQDMAPQPQPPQAPTPPIQPGLNGFVATRPREVEGQPAGSVAP